jgi:hypothetical protein
MMAVLNLDKRKTWRRAGAGGRRRALRIESALTGPTEMEA